MLPPCVSVVYSTILIEQYPSCFLSSLVPSLSARGLALGQREPAAGRSQDPRRPVPSHRCSHASTVWSPRTLHRTPLLFLKYHEGNTDTQLPGRPTQTLISPAAAPRTHPQASPSAQLLCLSRPSLSHPASSLSSSLCSAVSLSPLSGFYIARLASLPVDHMTLERSMIFYINKPTRSSFGAWH